MPYHLEEDQRFLKQFIVKEKINSGFYGELYSIERTSSEELMDVLYIEAPIDEFESNLENFKAAHFNLIDKKNEWTNILVPQDCLKYKDKVTKKDLLCAFFPEKSLQSSLSHLIGWDRRQRIADNFNAINQKNLISGLINSIIELGEKKRCHGFITPATIYAVGELYKPAFLGLENLLFKSDDESYRILPEPEVDLYSYFCFAPETMENGKISIASDMWSFGILISLLFTGKMPFSYESSQKFFEAMHSGQFSINTENIPEEFVSLVNKCLLPDPDARADYYILYKYSLNNNITHDVKVDLPVDTGENSEQSSSNGEWYSLESNEKFLLDSHQAISKNSVTIIPRNGLAISPSLKSIGKKLRLKIRSANSLQSMLYYIELLPQPKIEVQDNQSFLLRLSNNSKLKGTVVLLLNSSSILIDGVSINIDDSGQGVENISYEKKRINFAGSPKRFVISFDYNPNQNKIGKINATSITLNIRNHDDITLQFGLKYHFPADIRMNDDILRRLSVPRNTRQDFKLSLINTGGSPASNINLRTELSYGVVSLSPSFIDFFNPEESINITFRINTEIINQDELITGYLILEYLDIALNETITKRIPLNISVTTPELVEIMAIDFGTSNTCVAFGRANEKVQEMRLPAITEREKDDESFHSVLYYNDRQSVIIGKDAFEKMQELSENAFHSAKKFIGKGKNALLIFCDGMAQYTYEKLCYDFLNQLMNEIRLDNNYQFNALQYVFTYPTGYDNEISKKDCFIKIIKELNLNVNQNDIHYIDEASAGAVHFIKNMNLELEKEMYILIYDFGGGTTDIVFGKVSWRSYEDEITGLSELKKCFEPMYVSGFDFGGENINEIIISEFITMVSRLEDQNGKLLPYISPLKNYNGAINFDKNTLSIIGSNNISLWKLAEAFKINLSEPDITRVIEKIDVGSIKLKYIRNGDVTNPVSWDFTDVNQYAMSDLAGKTEFWEILKKNILIKVGAILDDCIVKTLLSVSQYCSEEDEMEVLLVGNSSKFQLVQDIFNYYLRINVDNLKYYHPVCDPVEFNHKINLKVAEKLKSIVSLGAIDLAYKKVIIDNSRLLVDIVLQGNTIIKRSSIKIEGYNEFKRLLIKGNTTDYAIFCGPLFKLNYQSVNLEFYKQIKAETVPAKAGRLSANFKHELIGSELRWAIFVDLYNDINWAFFDKDWNIIFEGKVE